MRSVVCAAVALSVLALATPSHASNHPSITGSCPTATAMDFRVTSIQQHRFQNLIAETSVDFVQGGTGPGCVVVIFASPVAGSRPAYLVTTLDGSEEGHPAWPVPTSTTFMFILQDVPPGPHNVQMKIVPLNVRVTMGPLVTLVYHSP